MKKPKVDPEVERQQEIARRERFDRAQEDAVSATEDLHRLFGNRMLSGKPVSGMTQVTRR